MDWNPAYTWLVIGLLLGLAELTSGALLLLALGLAAALTAGVAALGLALPWQLLAMGAFSGILLPLTIWFIRPWFSPSGVAYGTTGTGVEQGSTYRVIQRDFDGALGIKVNGDFYRVRLEASVDTTSKPQLAAGMLVTFKEFDGTTAIVSIADHKET
ncbi:nodulation efficiency, NfeD-like protein [Halomonas sabkhae]|uniref:NfeD family protein n=1 Tax=Halomonas sabkhae TaxID=626223 RepID=UPI0025B5AADC|nr:nodulation efficiency, NfeD-like protein [Halomonas sabkhae]MDN3524717.1 nodulation efficiency, NfeD-like protein [Halomonas sabkhae]